MRALFGWIVFLSSLNLLGAILGVSLPLISSCVRSVLYQGLSESRVEHSRSEIYIKHLERSSACKDADAIVYGKSFSLTLMP